MKKSLNRKLSSALSLILAFALMIGAVPLTVFAQNSGQGTSTPALDKTINYVSLGDSMTNGYGLYGYHGNTGVEDYGNDSYANQFAKWLAMDGATVSHAQLAMSAMRAEDLHWLLEVDYDDPAVKAVIAELNAKENYYKNYDNIEKFNEVWYSVFTTGDYWTWDQMVNDYRFDVAAYCIEGKDKTDDGIFNEGSDEYPAGYKVAYKKYTDVEALQIVAKYYQTSVKEADVISLGIGNGNFGVFMFGRILEAIDFDGAPKDAMIYDVENAIRECDPELQDQLRKLMAEADAILASKGFVADDGDDTTVSTMEALYNTFMYATISYALNYAGTVEAILQLNPDAEIIQVALMNTMLDNTAVTDEVTLGDVMDLLFKPLNVYIAALPTYMQGTQNSVYADATFYWAEAPFVECIVDTYDDGPLNEIVRDRFYQAIVKDENGKIGMVWELLRDVVVPVTLAQIEAYEDLEDADKVAFAVASTSNTELAMSISMYLAFEKAIIAGKNTPVTIDSVMGVADLFADDADPFGSIMDDFYAAAAVAGKAQYQTVANVLAQGDADEATLIMVLLGDEEAVKTLASSLVDWANISGTHKSIEEILDCEKEMCGFGCEEARAAYADLKANPVYGVIALQSSGALTGAEVKTLYETDDWTTAATEVVAGRSEGQLTAKQVMALYTAVKDMDATARQNVYIYEVAKAINGGNIEDPDFSQVKNVVVEAVDAGDYGNADQKAIKAQVDGLAAAVTGVETIISMQGTIERGVDSANGIATGAQRLCTLLVMPAELSKSVAKSELSGLLALFARCVIGNGIGSHPSENGHNALFEAVKKAHEEEYTAQDQTIANIIYYVSEYYDEAYAYGYQYAVENGYVADAMEAIRVAGKEVRALKELVDSSELSDELKAELNEEIKLIDLVLFDIWTILENDEADELDEDALNALVDLLGKLNTAVANLADVAEVAASDAADAAAVELAKLVEALEEKWTNEWKPALENTAKVIAEAAYEYIVEALGDAYDYLVEAITDAVVEYFPVAADAVYNYLYNNPEEVIEFVKTYGPYVVDVMKEYGDEALAVLGYVLYTYGEDIAAYVVENADKILSALVSWIEVHGENTAALLQVYAEALGLCDAVR
ncbi:MAG: hypothetical protein IJX47_08475, partial [Clostridia bacterium]|nr:hypothetical protein [Clostridia bacterium]